MRDGFPLRQTGWEAAGDANSALMAYFSVSVEYVPFLSMKNALVDCVPEERVIANQLENVPLTRSFDSRAVLVRASVELHALDSRGVKEPVALGVALQRGEGDEADI